ncbi:hypothetical protein B0F90DRAFT_1782068, partial [Multifurca ochricompacta]
MHDTINDCFRAINRVHRHVQWSKPDKVCHPWHASAHESHPASRILINRAFSLAHLIEGSVREFNARASSTMPYHFNCGCEPPAHIFGVMCRCLNGMDV